MKGFFLISGMMIFIITVSYFLEVYYEQEKPINFYYFGFFIGLGLLLLTLGYN